MFNLLSLGNALESSMGGGGGVKEWRGDTSLQSEGDVPYGWCHIFTTGLTIRGLFFNRVTVRGRSFSGFGSKKILVSRGFKFGRIRG